MTSISACGNEREIRFEQVYSASNGPDRVYVRYFGSPDELRSSWVATKLDVGSYKNLIEKVDFSKQMVLAFGVGKIQSFSGNIAINSVYQYTGVEDLPMNIRVKLGILRNECKLEKFSFPFVLAIIERPQRLSAESGYDVSTFTDECPR